MTGRFLAGLSAMIAVLALTCAPAQSQQNRRPETPHNRLVVAATPGAPPLSCQANKMFNCGSAGCSVEDHPTGLPVQLDLKTAEGKGYLCTYTYCRSFNLMGWRGRPKATGLVWSSQSGSTPPADRIPSYDFTLTVADDWSGFTLSMPNNGGVSGYSGPCQRPS